MAIPGSVIAAGWIPFIVVIVLVILFSGLYIRYFMHKYDSETSTTLTAIFALIVALLTSAIVPVDIFLVSHMKDSNGHFKDWANVSSVRDATESSVLITYYVLYGVVAFFLFLLLPFMYFFYEEKDDESTEFSTRFCSAMKFTVVGILLAVTFFLIGAFVPTKSTPNANSTEWKKIEALFKDMSSTRIEDALSFVICLFSLFGMLGAVIYTAYGLSAFPMGLIRGRRSVKKERLENQERMQEKQARREARRAKYLGNSSVSSYSRGSSRNGNPIDEEDHLIHRREKHLAAAERSWLRKCHCLLRPFEVVFGVILFLVALLILISLLLTNIDKAIHSLGYISGYALPERHLPNPVDIVLVFLQKVFPLDYIMMVGIIAYFVLCSMSGIRNIGIWFFWIKMYRIRPRRTSPQGLLIFCMILMFIILAINILLYELTPQYSSFGSQHYVNITMTGGKAVEHVKQCTTEVDENMCVVTRMTLLLVRLFYKMWFFGVAYYWGTWLFILTSIISFLIVVIKRTRSAISGEVDEDDFDDSDDEMIRG